MAYNKARMPLPGEEDIFGTSEYVRSALGTNGPSRPPKSSAYEGEDIFGNLTTLGLRVPPRPQKPSEYSSFSLHPVQSISSQYNQNVTDMLQRNQQGTDIYGNQIVFPPKKGGRFTMRKLTNNMRRGTRFLRKGLRKGTRFVRKGLRKGSRFVRKGSRFLTKRKRRM